MPGKNPIVQCFVFLCFSAALSIVFLEWHDPFSLKTVKTPASTPMVQTQSVTSTNPATPAEPRRRSWLPWLRDKTESKATISVKLVVKLSQRQVLLYQDQTLIKQYPVAIGQAEWQTPVGNFTVENMQKDPAWQHPITDEVITAGPENPLGSRWIGFWQDGTVQIGFHGTNQETLIGQAVSHGCVRMLNRDIEALYDLVEPGTPVVVEP